MCFGFLKIRGVFFKFFTRKEMRHIFHSSLFRSFNYTAKYSTPQILSFVTFAVFVALHGTLNLQTVSLGKQVIQ